MISIGIDIGVSGALAVVDDRGKSSVHDLPTVPDGDKKRLDGRGLILLLRQLVPVNETAVVVFEDVRPRPNPTRGTSIVTEGSLMRSRGIVECAIDIARLQVKVVQPQTWKRYYALIGKDKPVSREKAITLYPAAAPDLKRVKDHNRAEALLIAHWGLRTLA